jgi:hypothetical protein
VPTSWGKREMEKMRKEEREEERRGEERREREREYLLLGDFGT